MTSPENPSFPRYLQAILDETLRVKPPSGGGFRLAEEELQIGAVAATFRGLGGAGEKVEKPGKMWENWGGIWKKWEKLGETIGGNVELGKTGGKWKKTFVLYHDKWIKYGEMRFVSD